MRVYYPDFTQLNFAEQTISNTLHTLRTNAQATATHQQIHRLRHKAGRAVLNRNDSVVNFLPFRRGKNMVEGWVRSELHALAKTSQRGLMTPRSFRSQVPHPQSPLQQVAATDNLSVDAEKRRLRQNPVIERCKLFALGALTFWHEEGRTFLLLDLSHAVHALHTLLEEFHDGSVDAIDLCP